MRNQLPLQNHARLRDTQREQCAPCLVEMSDLMHRGRAGSETSLPGFNSWASGMQPGHEPSYRHHRREKVVHQHCTESPLGHSLTSQESEASALFYFMVLCWQVCISPTLSQPNQQYRVCSVHQGVPCASVSLSKKL